MIAFVLIVYFNFANASTSFTINDIATAKQCQILAEHILKDFGENMTTQINTRCYAYRKAAS